MFWANLEGTLSQIHPSVNCSADDFYEREVGELPVPPEPVNLISLQTYRLPVCFSGNLKERNPYWKQPE